MRRARQVSHGTLGLDIAYERIDGGIDDDDGSTFKVLGLVERCGRGLDRASHNANLGRANREQEGREGIFHDVPGSLPALLYARKVQQRAKAVGFEYPDLEGAYADLRSELVELEEDWSPDELGDVLFAAVNVARKLDVDPELELRRATARFRERVEVAEALAAKDGENWSELPLERQDRYFDLAKETTA